MAPSAEGANPRTAQLFRCPPSFFGTQLGIAVLIYWDVLCLRFLSLPAVTSASEVLTQTYRSGGVCSGWRVGLITQRSEKSKVS